MKSKLGSLTRLLLISFVIFTILPMAICIAAVPQTINYQGYLADSGGTPVNGTVQMQFKLYSSESATASPLWTETHQSVQVNQGSYSVVLGNGSPTPVPIDLPFDVQYYLGVKVGSDAEMTPRLPLTSMGYAFHATQADGLSSSATLTATNAIVSTVPTGVAPLAVASTTLVPNLNADMVGGKHASDLVAKAGDTMTGNLTVPSATLNGILTLPTTSATAGIIMQGGNTLIHSYGNLNFFAGRDSGNLTMTGFGNTASGYLTLYPNTTGYFNTAGGAFALRRNTTGIGNTAYGANTLTANDAGSNNTASGIQALSDNLTGNYNTATGESALAMNSAGSANTASGSAALLSTTTGSYNTASGYRALYSNTTGNYNTAVGYGADVYTGSLTNATAIGANAVVDASNTVRIGDTNVQSIRAHVSGITADSDLREKKDIQDIGYGLSFIKTLRPVQYRLKEGNNRIDFGFIAQDIETLLGIDYNILGIGGTEERMLSLRYTDFIAPMVKAMQEQQVIIDDLKARIEKLEALLAAQP